MPRYRVIANPPGRHRKGGYALHDSRPHPILGEDVEGYGWWEYHPPKPGNSVVCWFKRRRDAQARADVLNAHCS